MTDIDLDTLLGDFAAVIELRGSLRASDWSQRTEASAQRIRDAFAALSKQLAELTESRDNWRDLAQLAKKERDQYRAQAIATGDALATQNLKLDRISDLVGDPWMNPKTSAEPIRNILDQS